MKVCERFRQNCPTIAFGNSGVFIIRPKQGQKFDIHLWIGAQTNSKHLTGLKRLAAILLFLGFADYTEPFLLHTDASTEGIGAGLHKEIDGMKHVIAYASCSFSKSEQNYPIHKLEFLALKSPKNSMII